MPADHSGQTAHSTRLPTAVRSVASVAETVAFWAAVVLPLVYVPLFVVGLAGLSDEVVLGLLSANVLALLLGARHEERTEPGRSGG